MKKKKIIPIISAALAVIVCTGLLLGFTVFGEARPKAKDINNSSIIIGTYLIDFAVLNAENQALAEKNAEDTAQSKVYYKSDINKGVWYDITDAENVSDISLQNSKIVSNSVIDALTITLYFKADGTVVDYTTGSSIAAHDIENTVLPSNMPELKSLLEQKDVIQKLCNADYDDDSDVETEKHENYLQQLTSINNIFEPINNSGTAYMAEQLNAYDKSVQALTEQGAIDTVVAQKLKKKAERDIYCYTVVNERLNAVTEWLGELDKTAHTDFIATIGDCITAINGTLTDLASQLGAEDSSATGEEKTKLSEELDNAVLSGDAESIQDIAEKMEVLDAIINGEECDDSAAAGLLEEMLSQIPSSVSDIVDSVFNQTNAYYTESGTVSESEVLASVNDLITDARAYAKDIAKRLTGDADSAEGKSVTAAKLSALGNALASISDKTPLDSLQKALKDTVLSKSSDILDDAAEAKALSSSALSDNLNSISDLETAADAKYEEYMQALESGDAALAAQLKTELNALSDKLDGLQQASDLSALYNELFTLKSDNATAEEMRDVKASIVSAKSSLSAADSLLMSDIDDAISALEEAIDNSSPEDAKTALSTLSSSVANVGDNVLDSSAKGALLSYAAKALTDAANSGDSYLSAAFSDAAAEASAAADNSTDNSSAASAALSNLLSEKSKKAAADKQVNELKQKIENLSTMLNSSADKQGGEMKTLIDGMEKAVSDIEKSAVNANAAAISDSCDKLIDLLKNENKGALSDKTSKAVADYLSDLLSEAEKTMGADNAKVTAEAIGKLNDLAKASTDGADSAEGSGTGPAADSAAEDGIIGSIANELYGEKKSLVAAEKAAKEAAADTVTAENRLSAASPADSTDKAALNNLNGALEALQKAAEALNGKEAEKTFENLNKAITAAPSSLLDDNAKTDIAAFANDLLNTALDKCRDNGDDENGDIFEKLLGGAGLASTDTSATIEDSLYAYKLVIADYDIYSNSLTFEAGGTTYVKILDAARTMGASVITADDVYVIKGENILIEFTEGSSTAYIGDKLYAMSNAAFVSGGSVYAPLELLADGFSLTVTTEEGCNFLRKESE